MKLIEGLKQIKDLQKKAEDLRDKVKNNCALSSLETSAYPEPAKQVRKWVQMHSDVVKEILRLRLAVQKTNIATKVKINLDGKEVEKTIAEWIHRRRDLAEEEMKIWKSLTDRNVQEGIVKGPSGDPIEIKIQRFYDAEERDNKIELYRQEPMIIDSTLEIVNAITELEE